MISASNCSASSIASEVFPTAVGPTIKRVSFTRSGFSPKGVLTHFSLRGGRGRETPDEGCLLIPETASTPNNQHPTSNAKRIKENRETGVSATSPELNLNRQLAPRMVGRFRPAHDQLAAKELLVMKLAHCPLRFFHGLHLHECETLRALVVFVAHNLGVLDVADAIEQVEQVALRGIESHASHIDPL